MAMVDEVLKAFSVEEAYRHVRWLAENASPRLSGSAEARRAAEYVAQALNGYGVPAKIEEFDALLSFPLEAELRVLSPEARVIGCRPHAQSVSTLPEGLEGELVYVGAGSDENFRKSNILGKMALTEYSYAPPLDEQMRLADAYGARALVVMCWGLPEQDILSYGTTKPLWGNPTPETMRQLPSIPSLRITRQAGEYLRALCLRGPVRIWMRSEATREWLRAHQPEGSLKGAAEPPLYVLLAGHLDAWGAGVTCNATGVAMLLELARVFAHLEFHRGIKFCFWAAHETGGMEGSTWYIDTHWRDLNRNCIAHINIDTPDPIGGTRFLPQASGEAVAFYTRTAREILGGEVPVEECERISRTGDQSFFGLGIPSFAGRMALPREVIEKWNWAGYGWWYHSEADTIDKADPVNFGRTFRVMATLVSRMTGDPVLPFEFVSVASEFLGRIEAVKAEVKGGLEMGQAVEAAMALKERVTALDKTVESIKARAGELGEEDFRVACDSVNRGLMHLSRILNPVLYTVSGKYNQDTYGLSALSKAIPGMDGMAELGALGKESERYRLLWTKLIRERNKVVDALDEAKEEAQRVAEEVGRFLR